LEEGELTGAGAALVGVRPRTARAARMALATFVRFRLRVFSQLALLIAPAAPVGSVASDAARANVRLIRTMIARMRANLTLTTRIQKLAVRTLLQTSAEKRFNEKQKWRQKCFNNKNILKFLFIFDLPSIFAHRVFTKMTL